MCDEKNSYINCKYFKNLHYLMDNNYILKQDHFILFSKILPTFFFLKGNSKFTTPFLFSIVQSFPDLLSLVSLLQSYISTSI